MKYLSVFLQVATDNIVEITEKTTEVAEQSFKTDFIGIGGIVATIFVGVVTCWVTWYVTMRSIKQLKIIYSMKYYPILSNAINISNHSQTDGFKILYRNKLLENPCLLAVDIENIGNRAIENPPIRVCTEEELQMIPGYFENIPAGYEEIWDIESNSLNSCNIKLQHINPKQTVHVRFYLNKQPQKDFQFECPMPDLQLQKNYNGIKENNSINKFSSPFLFVNVALTILLAFCFITIENWAILFDKLIWYTDAHVESRIMVYYIMGILLAALLMNIFRTRQLTTIIKRHSTFMKILSVLMIATSFILLYLIVYDVLIIYMIPQMITAVMVLIMLSLSIHILTIIKS